MLLIRSTTLSCLVVLGLVAACGDHSIPSPVDTPDGCDKACATGEACESGVCVATCQIDGKQVVAAKSQNE